MQSEKPRTELKQPLTHNPHFARAGDFIFTSSIYPIDWEGRAVTADHGLQYIRESEMEAQTRYCLERLKAVLETAGSSLDLAVKADVHLRDAADFHDFKMIWRQYFASDPPARTTVEVGDELPFGGARLNLDAVALAKDGTTRKEVLFSPDVPDPREAEWASYAVRAGNLVFCSGLPATDYRTGIVGGKPPGFPNYGNEAESQAEFIFGNLNKVLAQAGTSLENAVESQLYESNLLTFHDVDRVWFKYMPVPPPRSSMGVKGFTVPGALCVANLVILVPDADHQKQESRAGLRWHPEDARSVHFSPTMKAGRWRFFAGQVPTEDFKSHHGTPRGLPHHHSDIEEQTRFTMQLLKEQLEAAETDWQHCIHARVYLTDTRRDYRGFERVWREYFPDAAQAPALALVPTTGIMFHGPIIEIDPTCVAK